MIRRLLPRLPQESAERLFELFEINDIVPSGVGPVPDYQPYRVLPAYNPLYLLYHDRAVAERWKRKAAARMHQVVEMELGGETQPRTVEERAEECYSYILGRMARADELPVGTEFYQDEIAFMLEQETGWPVVDPWLTAKVMGWLERPELRHSFARRQILPPEGADEYDYFCVYDQKTFAFAEEIRREFPADKELTDRLAVLTSRF